MRTPEHAAQPMAACACCTGAATVVIPLRSCFYRQEHCRRVNCRLCASRGPICTLALRAARPFPCEVLLMNQADTAWMLISTALVLLMTPALAFFYGGLVRSKNALNTMMMSFISLGFVGILWALIGYSLALTNPDNSWIGNTSLAFLNGVGLEPTGAV